MINISIGDYFKSESGIEGYVNQLRFSGDGELTEVQVSTKENTSITIDVSSITNWHSVASLEYIADDQREEGEELTTLPCANYVVEPVFIGQDDSQEETRGSFCATPSMLDIVLKLNTIINYLNKK